MLYSLWITSELVDTMEGCRMLRTAFTDGQQAA